MKLFVGKKDQRAVPFGGGGVTPHRVGGCRAKRDRGDRPFGAAPRIYAPSLREGVRGWGSLGEVTPFLCFMRKPWSDEQGTVQRCSVRILIALSF